jgi:hypothetical protein
VVADDNDDAAETLRLLMKSLGSGMYAYELARRMRAESWAKEALLVDSR